MTTHVKDGKLLIPSMKETCSPEEWQARVDLAACYRLVDLYGMSDLIANHISMRVPGEDNAFLINPYGLLYEEMTASSLIKVDHEGRMLGRPDFGTLDYGVNRAGFVIHSAVHMARHDVACVLHTHTLATMAVSSLACGLLPMNQTAMRFATIGYHDFQGVATNEEERASIAADLGDRQALMLNNHGALTVGRSIAEAFNWMHRLELSCRAQLAAMACNTPLVPVPDEVLQMTWKMFQPSTKRGYGELDWPALLRKLDRLDKSFRD